MDPTDGYSYPFNQMPPPLEIPDPSAENAAKGVVLEWVF